MATHVLHKPDQQRSAEDWPSGVPKRGMGAARNELLAVAAGIAVLALIAFAFWFEATH